MKYKRVIQKPYSCVPACVQMVLRRRRLPAPSQSDIGYELGMVVPPAKRNIFGVRSHSGVKPKSGWGTRINLKKYSLGRFFKKRNLPLTEIYYPAKKFKSFNEFENLIRQNLKLGNDLLTCFNYPLLYHDDWAWGHASLVERIETNHIILIDPRKEHKGPQKVKIDDFFTAVENHPGGGIWVIK